MEKTVSRTQYYQSLDLYLSSSPTLSGAVIGDAIPNTQNWSANKTNLETLVLNCSSIWSTEPEAEVAVKVVLAPRDGFLCRKDLLDVRFRHSDHVDSIVKFQSLYDQLSAVAPKDDKFLLNVLSSSPGALLLKRTPNPQLGSLGMLEADLRNRLCFDWLLPNKPIARRVAVIGGRPLFDWDRGSYGSRGPFEAALGLGISLTILDRPGHWLEGETYAHLRDNFIAIDVANEAELPSIIVEALKDELIDGIVTFSDEFVIATAKAAEMLKLPTEPVQAILRAHHKDETRKTLDNPHIQMLRIDPAKQLEDPATKDSLQTLHYPLIVKPCRGGASRGVRKVHDHSSMQQAILQMEEDGLAKHGILLETYVDGPEVDANFMLWDGEVIFCEISDDFPCLADSAEATADDNFVETLMVLPSRLPQAELDTIRTSLHQDLLKLGFRTGVFHVEGRIQNSALRYAETDGIIDLVETATTNPAAPWSFLIEVNARPPGLDCVYSTVDTYGVDMCALHYLAAIGDRERFAALSKPFSSGAQYWCGNSQIPIHRDDIRVPEDFFDQVLQRLPDVAPYVTRAELFTQPGAVVSPRGGAGFIAYFMLISRTSRRHVLEMSIRIQVVSKAVLDSP